MDRIWAALKNNLPQKIIAIVFAVILWTYVMGEQNPYTTRIIRNVPVEIQNEASLKDKHLVWMNKEIKDISVKIQGRRDDVARFRPDNIKAIIDLNIIEKSGEQTVPVKVVNIPSNIEVAEVTPNKIEVVIDDMVTNQLPVELKIQGQVAVGHTLLSNEINPSDVAITGPASIISKINMAVVQLNLDNAKYDVERSLPVMLLDNNGKQVVDQVDISDRFIKVYQKIRALKSVPVKVNTTGQLPDGLEIDNISVSPDSVTVAGSDDSLESLNTIDIQPLDLSQISTNSTVQAQLLLPEGVELVDKKPVMVNISVKEKNVQKDVSVSNIILENIPNDAKIENKPEKFVVSIMGPYNLIKDIDSSDIKIVLDAGSISRGRHDLIPKVILPDGIEVQKIEPSTIAVSFK